MAMGACVTGLLCVLFCASGKGILNVCLNLMISCSSLYFGHYLVEAGRFCSHLTHFGVGWLFSQLMHSVPTECINCENTKPVSYYWINNNTYTTSISINKTLQDPSSFIPYSQTRQDNTTTQSNPQNPPSHHPLHLNPKENNLKAVTEYIHLTHSYLLNKEQSPNCDHCRSLLTVEHILTSCSAYKNITVEL